MTGRWGTEGAKWQLQALAYRFGHGGGWWGFEGLSNRGDAIREDQKQK